MKHLKVVFVLIISIVNLTFALDYPDYFSPQAGSAAYGQQEMNKSGNVNQTGAVVYSYSMGDVGLYYDSNSGWKIGGHSAITRSTRKGAAWYMKDSLKDPHFKNVYELNGEELILVSSATANPLEYRTKKESFKKILFYNPISYFGSQPVSDDSSYWVVHNPDGSKEVYGNNENSKIRMVDPYILTVSNKSLIRDWAITKIEGKGGYDITDFVYVLGTGGAYYLSKVLKHKPGCGSNGYAVTKLVYADETDPVKKPISYRTGSKVQVDKYLTYVQLYMGTDSSGNGGYLLNEYKIEYVDGSIGQRLVSQITPYGSDGRIGKSLNPTKFYYSGANKSFSSTPDWTIPGDNEFLRHADKDGTYTSNLIDMDGDGLVDRVVKSKGSNNLKIYFNNGNGFDAPVDWMVDDDEALTQVEIERSSIDLTAFGAQLYFAPSPSEILVIKNNYGNGAIQNLGGVQVLWPGLSSLNNRGGRSIHSPGNVSILGSLGHGTVVEDINYCFNNRLFNENDVKSLLEALNIPKFGFDHKNTTNAFIDVNGDGKPDRLSAKTPVTDVQLNKGDRSGFETTSPGLIPSQSFSFNTYSIKAYANRGKSYLINWLSDNSSLSAGYLRLFDPDHMYEEYYDIDMKRYSWVTPSYADSVAMLVIVDVEEPSLVDAGTMVDTADFNGDGILDVFWRNGEVLLGPLYKNKQNYMFDGQHNMTMMRDNNLYISLLDINGDGLPERIRKVPHTDDGKLLYRFNKGFNNSISMESLVTVDKKYIVEASDRHAVYDFIDMNGDGYPDRVHKDGSGADKKLYVSLNKSGNAFGPEEDWGYTDDNYLRQGADDRYSQSADYVDMNGDGLPDRVVKDKASNNYRIWFNQCGAADKLVKVISPEGGVTTYSYKALDKAENRDMKQSLWVVDEVRVCDGITYKDPATTPLVTRYKYKDGVYDYTEREFRGFGCVKVVHPTYDCVETSYHTDEDRQGLPYLIVHRATDGGNLVQRSAYTYDVYKPSDRYLPGMDPRITLVLPKDETSDILNGSPFYRKIKYTREFDPIDNPGFIARSSVINYGETNAAYEDFTGTTNIGNDVFEVKITYLNNTNLSSTVYLAGLEDVKEIYGYDGVVPYGVSLQLQARSKNVYYYEGETQGNGIIVRGRMLKQSTAWNGSNYENATCFEYDGSGNVMAVTDPNLNKTTTVYDSKYGRFPVKTTDARGFSSFFYYDKGDYTGTNTSTISINITHGRLYMTRDINNQFFNSRYDVFGRAIKVWGPSGSEMQPDEVITYINADLVYTDPNKVINMPAGIFRDKFTVRGSKWPNNDLWSFSLSDGLGRVIQVKSNGLENDGKFNIVDTEYTLNSDDTGYYYETIGYAPYTSGNSGPDLVVRPAGIPKKRTLNYNLLSGKQLTVVFNTDSSNSSIYKYGNSTIIKDENDNESESRINGAGRIISVKDAKGITTEYQYKTGTGALLRIDHATNAGLINPVFTMYTYNLLGQKVSVKDPDMGVVSYTYDNNGNIKTITDAKNVTTTYSYDVLNRLTAASATAGSEYYETVNIYDAGVVNDWYAGYPRGRLVATCSTSPRLIHTMLYSYDQEGRIVKEKSQFFESGAVKAAVKEYTYNAGGQITGVKYPDGEQLTYEYDNMSGREIRVRDQNWYQYVKSVNYLRYGRISKMVYGNDVETSYLYYDNGEDLDSTIPVNPYIDKSYHLHKIAFKKSGGIDQWQTYNYDSIGNIKNITDKNPALSQAFTYDALNRLTNAEGIYNAAGYNYDYDAIGNMILKEGMSQQYTDASHPHAVTYTGPSGYSFTYDENGNMVTKSGRTPSQERTYTYDTNNMLRSIKDGAGWTRYSAEYNGTKRVKTREATGITTYYFFPEYEETWLGSEKYEIINYYFSNGQRIAERRKNLLSGTNVLSYYHKDHLGSTVKMTDTAGRDTGVKTIYYKPYGETASEDGILNPDYRFNDKEITIDNELYYYESRYYNPAIGRFISPDPVTPGGGADLQGLNRYSYCLNNPVVYTDPTGHEPWANGYYSGNYNPDYKESAYYTVGQGPSSSFGAGTNYSINTFGDYRLGLSIEATVKEALSAYFSFAYGDNTDNTPGFSNEFTASLGGNIPLGRKFYLTVNGSSRISDFYSGEIVSEHNRDWGLSGNAGAGFRVGRLSGEVNFIGNRSWLFTNNEDVQSGSSTGFGRGGSAMLSINVSSNIIKAQYELTGGGKSITKLLGPSRGGTGPAALALGNTTQQNVGLSYIAPNKNSIGSNWMRSNYHNGTSTIITNQIGINGRIGLGLNSINAGVGVSRSDQYGKPNFNFSLGYTRWSHF